MLDLARPNSKTTISSLNKYFLCYYGLVEVRMIFVMNIQVFLFIFLVIHSLFVC